MRPDLRLNCSEQTNDRCLPDYSGRSPDHNHIHLVNMCDKKLRP